MNQLEYLKHQWNQLLADYHLEKALTDAYFEELVAAYTETHRYYHTLSHLEALFQSLTEIDCDDQSILWSVWYHDIIYKPGRSDNELKSAELARLRMQALKLDSKTVNDVYDFIIATKHHQTQDPKCQLFLDADMAILGAELTAYKTYVEQVAMEFKRIPGFLYKRGRKKFLKTVLSSEKVFKSPVFYSRYEQQARANMQWELDSL